MEDLILSISYYSGYFVIEAGFYVPFGEVRVVCLRMSVLCA